MNTFTLRFKNLLLSALAIAPAISMAQFSGDEDTGFGQFGHFQYHGNDDETLMDIATVSGTNVTYLAGYNEGAADDNALLVCVWQNGAINNTFANGGVFEFDPQIGANDRFITVDTDVATKIVLGGYSEGATRDALITRVLFDGTLDLGFNSTGYVLLDGPGNGDDEIADIEVLSDGSILAVGYSEVNPNSFDFWVIKLNSNGSMDTNFGTNGYVFLDFGDVNERAIMAREMPNGTYVIGGTSGLESAVAMLNTDGSLDQNFSVDGKTTINMNDQTILTNMIPMSDGNLMVSGTTLSASDGYEAFARLLTDNGNISLSFANGGFESNVDPTTNNLDTSFLCYDMMELANGQFLLSGNILEVQSDVSLMLLNADGTVDTNFGSNGIRNYDLGGTNEINGQLGILGDGSIMLGTTTNDGDVDFAVYKLNPLMVGLEEETLFQNTILYPNPAHDQLTFQMELPEAANVQINIMDVSGKQVVQPMYLNLPQGLQTINLSDKVQPLAQGMYFIQCSNEVSSTTLNFLKR